MYSIDKIIGILNYKKRPDLAKILRGSNYGFNESGTYGSCLFSTLTTVEIYSSIDKNEQLQKLSNEDQNEIINAFLTIYPVRENSIEIKWIEFLVDPDVPIPKISNESSRLEEIDFLYINEQILKCNEKISTEDFDGAITNARNLVESICKYILDNLDEKYTDNDDLPNLYNKTSRMLNMHPIQHVENSFKQILSGCFSIIQGLATVRNSLSDAHGRSQIKQYKVDKRHAVFVVGSAKLVAEFMFASYMDNLKKKT